jgi:uncharacterized protein YdbL (DUF1318 family)
MKPHIALLIFSALSFLLVPLVQADDSLAKRMKARLPDVIAAKDTGAIGEGVDGVLHIRDDNASASVEKMVGAENKDRKTLFSSLAKKTGGSSAVVAEKFARAMIGKGKKGHWFRSSKGTWKKK